MRLELEPYLAQVCVSAGSDQKGLRIVRPVDGDAVHDLLDLQVQCRVPIKNAVDLYRLVVDLDRATHVPCAAVRLEAGPADRPTEILIRSSGSDSNSQISS